MNSPSPEGTPSRRPVHKPSHRTLLAGGQRVHVRDLRIQDGQLTVYSAGAFYCGERAKPSEGGGWLPHVITDIQTRTAYTVAYKGAATEPGKHATVFMIQKTEAVPQ